MGTTDLNVRASRIIKLQKTSLAAMFLIDIMERTISSSTTESQTPLPLALIVRAMSIPVLLARTITEHLISPGTDIVRVPTVRYMADVTTLSEHTSNPVPLTPTITAQLMALGVWMTLLYGLLLSRTDLASPILLPQVIEAGPRVVIRERRVSDHGHDLRGARSWPWIVLR
jgi:hypothetical protein